ncbi:MAG: type III-B CRISPR module-associated protein Cmr3 [Dehalococcoidia bacterium]|jgi:CRISPR-associated protein Cmr3
MIISLQALDTLFFRDAKPFNMREDFVATSVFPPYPSVIYGALRSAYFSSDISSLAYVNGPEDPTRNLRIRGIYLQVGEDICLPLPFDCARKKNGKQDDTAYLLTMFKAPAASSCPTPYILGPSFSEEIESVEDGLIELASFNDYLGSNTSCFSYLHMQECVLTENKLGIRQNRTTGTADEHCLYRIGMKRLESQVSKGRHNQRVSLIIDFEGMELPAEGLMRIGGEGKAAFYRNIESPMVVKPELINNWFKIYLATPAIFRLGWLPCWIDPQSGQGEYGGLKVRILTAAIGRYLTVGGYDIVKNSPKSMRRAVPAGSVYYLEVLEGERERVIELFHGNNISDFDSRQGFGLALVGGVYNG